MRTETPLRTVQLSSFYDAAETARDSDYQTFFSLVSEDFYFSSTTRALAVGRLRREIRNNPYLGGLVAKFPEAIGCSNFRSRSSKREYNQAKEKLYYRWAKRVTLSGDSLRSVEEIMWSELLVAGEFFLILLANGRLQMVPSEYCGSPTVAPKDSKLSGEVNGVVYSETQVPLAYRFGKMEGGIISFAESTLIDARFVVHVYRKDRVHMGRGLPWLIPSLRTAHDLYEITRSKTKQIKDANSISGVIYKENAREFLSGLAAPERDGNGDPVKEKPTDAADPTKKDPHIVELKKGTLIALEPGEKIESLMSDYEASDYKELVFMMLHAMSAPIGFPVELWFSGLGDVNYSGFKGLGTQWNGRRQYLILFAEEKMLDRVFFWRSSKWEKEGDIEPHPDGDHDLMEWAWRATAVLDDEKEAKANKAKLESGEECLADVWERKGFYADEVFERRRALWIHLKIAAGELDVGADHSKEKVPLLFLLRGKLEEELKTTPEAGAGGEREQGGDASTRPSA